MGIRRSSDIRGVRDIRTYSGRVDAASVPYLAYMKVSCLEMERARRERERNSALVRIQNIDSRIHDIEAEKDTILNKITENQRTRDLLASKNEGSRQRTGVNVNRTISSSGRESFKEKDGFKIRY